jgi:hypothetical protein
LSTVARIDLQINRVIDELTISTPNTEKFSKLTENLKGLALTRLSLISKIQIDDTGCGYIVKHS